MYHFSDKRDIAGEPIDDCKNPLIIENITTSGAIGFDWFTAGDGCVSWLIGRPRKKLITQ